MKTKIPNYIAVSLTGLSEERKSGTVIIKEVQLVEEPDSILHEQLPSLSSCPVIHC
jgi:hypothetical protein